jgi:TP901 family phage tail tape measure protein
MPPNDVVQRTEQLRDALRKLAESSDDAGTRLGKLESILNGLRDFNFTSVKEASSILASFNQNIKLMGADVNQIQKVSKAFMDLIASMQQAALVQKQFSSMGKAGVATKRYTAALGVGDEAQIAAQRTEIEKQKAAAEEAKRGLASLETYWKEIGSMAENIVALREEVFRRLFGKGGLPQLGAGTPGNYGTIFMGPGSNLTGYKPPLQLPSGKQQYPQLPSGAPIALLPAVTQPGIPMPTGTIHMPAHTEMLQNMEFLSTEAPEARFRRLTTIIDDAITTRVEKAAIEVETQPVSPGVRKAASDLDTRTGTGGKTSPQTLKQTRENIPMWVGEEKVSIENLKTIGLTEVAAKNLEKTMIDLGVTSARVTGNTTELSTGIQTVSFQAEGAGGSIRNFTAHLDRNGNVLADTQKRFRSFGSAVMRDVVEVLKWTIAITAIYTPIRKVGELLEQMKKIQLDLVDVQIVLGNSTQQFSTVLESTARIATETSSSLEGVIQGYSLAAAAASSAGDETQRTIATEKLLKDSMILSKLANIDQKQALDTLVGSLSQLGMGLMDGTRLLDSWVAVSKKANVSVKDMSTSFTIVGSAASEVGVDFNQLNALIGAMAQSTNLSADELGNAIRGIIATMQTDKAQQAFAEYGIATKSVSGDFRDLLDILKQVKEMSDTGVLNEKAMGALTQAGGGGARRGAQLSALIKNLDTVMNLTTISQNASGDAAKAMALEMDTLDASTTRLNNAFSELAITLGGEGGILGFLTAVTNMMTTLVKGVRDLSSVLKTAAPILGTFMLARGLLSTQQGAGLLNKNIPASLASLFIPATFNAGNIAGGGAITGAQKIGGFAPVSNWLLRRTQATGLGAKEVGGGLAQTASIGQFLGGMWNKINKPLYTAPMTAPFMKQPGQVSLGTMLGPLLIAASNIGQPGGGARAAMGGGVGLLVGALTGSGIWATVGATIATAFYDKFLTFSDDIATVWAQKISENTKPPPEEETPESALERLNKEARDSMSAWEIFKTNIATWGLNTWSKLPWSTQGGKQVTPEEVSLAGALNAIPGMLDQDTKDKLMEAYRQLMRNQAEATAEITIIPTTQQQEIARLAATASGDIMTKAMEQVAIGASGSIQNYLDAQTLAQKIGSTVTQLINTQMLMVQPTTIGIGQMTTKEGVAVPSQTIAPPTGFTPMTSAEAIKFVAGLNEEEASAIVSKYTEISDLLSKIQALNDQITNQGGIITEAQQKDLEDYASKLRELPTDFIKLLQIVEQGSKYRQIENKLLPTIDLPEMTPEQYQQVREAADKYWREYLKASGLTDEEAQQWIDAQHEALVTMEGQITPFKTNIPQQYFQQAAQEIGITGQGTTIQQMNNLTTAQVQQYSAQVPVLIDALNKMLKAQNMPLYQPNWQDLFVTTKDGYATIHTDFGILQLLTQDLIDVEKDKGLQGMYNLPSGGTFYVPVTAYEMSKATVTEMAGGGGTGGIIDILQQIFNWLQTNVPPEETVTPTEQQAQATMQHIEGLARRNFELGGDLAPQINSVPVSVTSWFGNTDPTQFSTPVPQQTYQLPMENVVQPPEENKYNWTGDAIKDLPIVGQVVLDTAQSLISQLAIAISEYFTGRSVNNEQPQTVLPQTEVPEVKLPDWLKNYFSPTAYMAPINPTALQTQLPTNQQPVTTALSLSVDQRVILSVDGRTLATIIKPYLYEDLIRYGTTSPASVNRSVIA